MTTAPSTTADPHEANEQRTEAESGRVGHLAPGSVVVVRDEEWFVRATEETADGLLVHVQGLGELVRDTTASFYAALDDIRPLDPAAATVVADGSPHYRTARLWLESTVRKTPVPLGDRSLTVATQALSNPLKYQQTAVRRALDPDHLRPRILLADAVGLGKTLEIGMILAELVRRGRGDRILIVTPRHVLEQMQHEMWTRFALPFVRLDSAGIQRVRQKMPATRNPFTYYKRVIISIDTLKRDNFHASLRKQRWDAVVIDESHNLSNSATQNNKLARLLARTGEALILASATPHNGRAESFAELIRLLDPSAVPPSGGLVAEEIEDLVIRRHRHSPEVAQVVGADWKPRQEPLNLLVPATLAEDAIARELEDVWLWPGEGGSPCSGQNATLFPWTLAKAFLSSPAALLETVKERTNRLGSGAEQERQALDRLGTLASDALGQPSAKYTKLLEHLRGIGVGKGKPARAVVFAERVATLRWLQEHLPKDLGLDASAVDMLHGGLADDEQQRIVETFKQETAPVRVLVTGDVASEGVNLHAQCHELVHFDIPWSLIRIEQRNGRIDRYGQKHPPRITALLLDPSSERFAGDVRVLASLMAKEDEAHTALGDAASLMGEYDVKAEEAQIRAVLARRATLDDVVRTPAEAAAGNDLTGLVARLAAGKAKNDDEPAVVDGAETNAGGTGLYRDDVSYLDDALHAAFIDPTASPSKNGVSWRRDDTFGTAELVPPKDLVQRLEVLPQTYLADRDVTAKLVLATKKTRGADRLAAALRDETGSNWPDAHYLGPLHPVLDWAADQALSNLGRNEVFAVRGDVEAPTVLLLGTLTNRRGQVVAAAWLTAAFPDPSDTDFVLVQAHASSAKALGAVGWDRERSNPGPLSDADKLTALVAPAVRRAQDQMHELFAAARDDVARRVEAWSGRFDRWDAEAGALIQRGELRTRRTSVAEERELATAMTPDRQLVRPLLVVVPEGEDEQ
ncbi:helicase [Actinomycetospora sp. NBRC 106375]|uniref:helicase-related protein n=1 Tax=Actinomycetospora sp. NBRC 106375 TaxID=3032207 RepID=UPI0024A14B58|nr:helicase-related protein [Actinomycetospora sp. NBRC 106375]GLZ49475.1 helicase [Actinomycetospora sp. NBRC 106375]